MPQRAITAGGSAGMRMARRPNARPMRLPTAAPIWVNPASSPTLAPAPFACFDFALDFSNVAIGRQEKSIRLGNGAFKRELSRARTFGFVEEVELLRKAGLARGGSLDNAIVIGADQVQHPKPHPEVYLTAAGRLGAKPHACLAVEDSEYGVRAAHAAGMPGLVATYGYLQADEDWRAWGGDGFIREPAELLPWLDRVERA